MSAPTVTRLTVVLDREDRRYKPGDEVRGHVTVTWKTSTRALTVELRRLEWVTWYEKVLEVLASIVLSEAATIPGGSTFPFTLTLPSDAPPHLDVRDAATGDAVGGVRWEVVARGDRFGPDDVGVVELLVERNAR